MTVKTQAVQKSPGNRGKMNGRNRRPKKGIAGMPGNPVTRLREELGLNVKQFATLVGMPYFTLMTLERGEVKRLTPEIMALLEKAGISHGAPEEYEKWRAEAVKKSAV
jgi:DNA-binding transcriptional regulator YiaG